jgi:hypothetical protein
MVKNSKLWILAILLGLTTVLQAGPLAPTLSAAEPRAGETTMFSPQYGKTVGYVEWMVLTPGDYGSKIFAPLVNDVFGSVVVPDGQYLYAYEVKSLVDKGSGLTVRADPATSIVQTGSSNLNLESVGHDSVTFSNLGAPGPSKHHVVNQTNMVPVSSIDVDENGMITWKFDDKLGKNQISETLWFVSTNIPEYRQALYQAGQTTGSGATTSGGGGTAHLPVPGAMVLGMFGLAIVGWIKRQLA